MTRQRDAFYACTGSRENSHEATKGKVEREMSRGDRDTSRCVKQISSPLVEDNSFGLYAIGHGNVSPEQCPLYVSISPLCRFYVFPRGQIEHLHGKSWMPALRFATSRTLDLLRNFDRRFHEFRGNLYDVFLYK